MIFLEGHACRAVARHFPLQLGQAILIINLTSVLCRLTVSRGYLGVSSGGWGVYVDQD